MKQRYCPDAYEIGKDIPRIELYIGKAHAIVPCGWVYQKISVGNRETVFKEDHQDGFLEKTFIWQKGSVALYPLHLLAQ